MIKSGIYTITNLINNKMYVGFTNNLDNRRDGHISCLRRGVHQNTILQRSWNKHGEINFKFEVLEECSEEHKQKLRLAKLGKNRK